MLKQIEGSAAVAEAVALCRPEVICAYPISPQTHIVEGLGKLVAAGQLKPCEFINEESKFAAMSVAIGASATDARAYTAQVARAYPLRTGERALDLGGGAATYAVAWTDACPGAEVTVFDTPGTLRVARKILREKGAEGRVRLVEGDFLVDPLGGPYDFVWISQILHAYAVPDCLRLLRRARASLSPGGRVAVQGFLLAEGKVSPPGPVFFSVHMVAMTDGGRSYTAGEIAGMLRKAGFPRIAVDPADARGVGVVRAIR